MRVNVLLSTGNSSMHTQHVKFSAYVAGGCGVGGAVAVGVVFEEGEVTEMVEDDDDNGSVLDVVVVVSFLSSFSSFLDCRGGGDEVVVVVDVSFLSLSLAFFVAFFSCTNRRCSS
jgi:hypothetical protein